ncbi:MAG: hypothetical protein AB8G22_18575, partial [Saprospiraceae bacterium]
MIINNKILLFGFVLILLFPLINGVTNILPNRNTENTNNKDYKFDLTNPVESIAKYDSYFKSNFSGRSFYFRSISQLKYHLFNNSVLPDKIIVGDDGFLFLGNGHASNIDKKMGMHLFRSSELQRIDKNLYDINTWLNGQGIKFYFVIAPDKATVYPELLPFTIDSDFVTPTEQLMESLTFPNVLDLSKGMEEAKDEELLFYRIDSHWTPYGAYLGYVSIMQELANDLPGLKIANADDFKRVKNVRCNMNLSKQIDVNLCEERYRMVYQNGSYGKLGKKKYTKIKNPNYERRFINPDGKHKLLL